jgi:Na+/melibiose symporter-like transporter
VNHFLGLAILSVVVAVIFSILNRNERREQIRYLAVLLVYMIVGSLAFAWVMYLLPPR